MEFFSTIFVFFAVTTTFLDVSGSTLNKRSATPENYGIIFNAPIHNSNVQSHFYGEDAWKSKSNLRNSCSCTVYHDSQNKTTMNITGTEWRSICDTAKVDNKDDRNAPNPRCFCQINYIDDGGIAINSNEGYAKICDAAGAGNSTSSPDAKAGEEKQDNRSSLQDCVCQVTLRQGGGLNFDLDSVGVHFEGDNKNSVFVTNYHPPIFPVYLYG